MNKQKILDLIQKYGKERSREEYFYGVHEDEDKIQAVCDKQAELLQEIEKELDL